MDYIQTLEQTIQDRKWDSSAISRNTLPDGRTEVSIICNDLFWWGCADAEPIESHADLAALVQAHDDSSEAGFELYCARRRRMRPQGAIYKYYSAEVQRLFDACGPDRSVDVLNPIHQAQSEARAMDELQ